MNTIAAIVAFVATALFVYLYRASFDKYMDVRDQIGQSAARLYFWAAWGWGLLSIAAAGVFAWQVTT